MNATEHVAMVESALRSNGYSPETVERASYCGCSMPPHPITRVTKGEFKGFAAEVGEPESLEHLRKIKAIQDMIPHVAKIHEIVERIVITEAAPGTLLWELETAPNHVQSVLSCLDAIRVALLHVGLVHADIRPWNIMFDQAPGHATLFDWGYSFFINEKPFGNLDAHLAGRGFDRSMGHEITRQDIDNCIAMLETRKSPEEIWNHGANEFSWRPTWCKRFEPPPNILRNNQTLFPGQEIRSKNGKYRLVYQADGNLVVYDDSQDKRPVWHSATHGRPAGRFVMQAVLVGFDRPKEQTIRHVKHSFLLRQLFEFEWMFISNAGLANSNQDHESPCLVQLVDYLEQILERLRLRNAVESVISTNAQQDHFATRLVT